MRFLFLLALSLGFVACEKEHTVSPATLTGVWIEETGHKDTLIFNLDRQGTPLPNTILVNRGKELNAGGSLVPKLGSGIYSYELKADTLWVINLLSSSSNRSAYKIDLKGNQLQIDNFYELGFNQPATASRTLVRL